MFVQVLLLVCLVPLVLSHGDDQFLKMLMDKMKEENGKEMETGGGGKDWGDAEYQQKMEAFSKFMEYQKRMQEHKAEEAKEQQEHLQKFLEFKRHLAEMKEREEQKEKTEMFEEFQQHQQLKEKMRKQEEMVEMMEKFKKQKEQFVYKITHEFTQLCQCAEVSAQMEQLTMMQMGANPTDMMEDMDMENATQSWENKDMEAFANTLKKMSKEQQKKIFMVGLVKSMCAGAKTFVMEAKKFAATYMMGNGSRGGNSTHTGGMRTTTMGSNVP